MEKNNDDNNDMEIVDENENEDSEDTASDDSIIEADSEKSKMKGKRKWIGLTIKISLIAIIIIVVIYLVYFSTTQGTARIIISNSEITDMNPGNVPETINFNKSDNIHFYIAKEGRDLDAELVAVSIEYFQKKSYTIYKQISYEIEKSFPRVKSFIPKEYFSRDGMYRIKILLDGKVVGIKEFQVSGNSVPEEK